MIDQQDFPLTLYGATLVGLEALVLGLAAATREGTLVASQRLNELRAAVNGHQHAAQHAPDVQAVLFDPEQPEVVDGERHQDVRRDLQPREWPGATLLTNSRPMTAPIPEAVELRRPLPDGLLEIVARGEKQDLPLSLASRLRVSRRCCCEMRG
jgi:hypothetical protein